MEAPACQDRKCDGDGGHCALDAIDVVDHKTRKEVVCRRRTGLSKRTTTAVMALMLRVGRCNDMSRRCGDLLLIGIVSFRYRLLYAR